MPAVILACVALVLALVAVLAVVALGCRLEQEIDARLADRQR